MAEQQGFNSFLTLPGPNPRSQAQNWELHKSTLKKLYVPSYGSGCSLESVMEIMERDHNFQASKKVYRRKFAKWGFERKMKGNERDAILRKLIERDAIGKQSAFMLRGSNVNLYKFGWEAKKTKNVIQNLVPQEGSGAATPPHLRCYTPEPSTWQTRQSAKFLEKFAKDIEAYRMRSTETGNLTGGTGSQDKNCSQLPISNETPTDWGSQEMPYTSPAGYPARATTRPNPP